MFLRFASALLLLVLAAFPARAQEDEAPTCDADCQQVVTDAVTQYMGDKAPSLVANWETFPPPAPSTVQCPPRTEKGPTVFGVLVGPAYKDNLKLDGTGNDARLIRQVMLDRGADDRRIKLLTGDSATRPAMIRAMADTLACLRERDQVVMMFSGRGFVDGWAEFALGWFIDEHCAAATEDNVKRVCDMLTADAANDPQAADKYDVVRQAFHTAMLPFNHHLLMTDESVWPEDGPVSVVGVSAAELSNFVTRVRNVGADAFVIADTAYAGALDLLAYQRDAAAAPGWSADGDTIIDQNGLPDPQKTQSEQGTVPLFGSGEFAAFYATNATSETSEDTQQGQDVFGEFTFRMAEALRREGRLPFRDIALDVAKALRDAGGTVPEFQASNADLAFLAPRAAPSAKDTSKDIEIISPAPKRGAAAVEEKSFTLVARYTGSGKVFKAIVDGDIVPVDDNGQFRKDITDTGGKIEIAIRVLSAELETLAATSLKLREADEPTEIVSAAGRKLALIIANEAYQDASFQQLKTPIADAKAIAEVLTTKFGFSTKIEQSGKTIDLFLANATKAQIAQMLFDLRRALTAEDQLIVYYAGHGENDPELGAYWVPVDGQPKADYTWLGADEITRELKRMNPRSVLVISDSCYSGGLSRGGAEEKPEPTGRDRWLAKAARMKSRQLMASGGVEPVEDGGGGGHSIFAKALIEALNGMGEKTFTASELFEQKVKPAVISAGSALTEGQTPGFHRITRAGDEPGSEFIFQLAAGTP